MATAHRRDTEFDPKYDHYDFPTVSVEARSGHPGYTTPEQDAQVHIMRHELEKAECTKRLDTMTLLRFLRARNWALTKPNKNTNQETAVEMFLKSEEWRKNGNVDTITTDFEYPEKPRIFEMYPQYYHKTDKDGRPLYIEKLGKINLTEMKKILAPDPSLSPTQVDEIGEGKLQRNLVYEYERLAESRLPAASRKAGHLVETCCTIMDLNGAGLGQFWRIKDFIQRMSDVSSANYPERLGRLYFINSPWGFTPIFNVIRYFVDPVTRLKLHSLGSKWKQELLEVIPAENLPAEFGGKCRCERGCVFSDAGPWNEDQYKNKAKPAANEEENTIHNEVGEGGPVHPVTEEEDGAVNAAPNAEGMKEDGFTIEGGTPSHTTA